VFKGEGLRGMRSCEAWRYFNPDYMQRLNFFNRKNKKTYIYLAYILVYLIVAPRAFPAAGRRRSAGFVAPACFPEGCETQVVYNPRIAISAACRD